MNMPTPSPVEPPAPRTLEAVGLPIVMMRDILLKTVFRTNAATATEIARAIALPLGTTHALIDLVREQNLIEALGSILMYGPPGNGKSSISNGIRNALGDTIYVPRAIEYAGQVITVYDPIVHTSVEHETHDDTALRLRKRHDARYVLCTRPTVITGGELKLDMLNLVYNPVARTYQAPLQLKSTGGVFIVDDLGGRKSRRRRSSTTGSCRSRHRRTSCRCNPAKSSRSRSTRS